MVERSYYGKAWSKYLEKISSQNGNLNIKQKGNKLLINDEFTIIPPRIQSIPEEIQKLRKNRIEKYYEYHEIYNDILNSEDDTVNEYKIKYQKIVDSINVIEDQIRNLIIMQNKINQTFAEKIETMVSETMIIEERNAMLKNNFDKPILDQAVLDQYNNDLTEARIRHEQIYREKMREVPDFYIVDDKSDNNELEQQTNIVKQFKNINTAQALEIKTSVKRLIADTFKFKNLDQCLNKTHSTSYWMPKTDIIKLINDNEKLRNIMPKKYKNMKREELCKTIEKMRENSN